MEEVLLKAQDQLKIDILSKLQCEQISKDHARLILNISERTLRRYLRKFKDKGVYSVLHANRFRSPKNKISDSIKLKVQRLIVEKYFDFNMTHLNEKLKEEGLVVKRETLRKWCHEINYVKKSKRRRAKSRSYRQRMEKAGVLLQMDGSYHKWYGDQESCLLAVIDDANNEIVYAEFCDYETTQDCFKAIRSIVESKGIFKALYVDQAGLYGGMKRNGFSQVKRACEELGIQVIYAHSPQAKGRIERLFSTLQDRLVAEMRLSKVKTRAQANEYLNTVFIPTQYHQKFLLQSIDPIPAYEKPHDLINLEQILCHKEFRVIGNDQTISLGNEKYYIDYQFKYSVAGYKLEIRTLSDSSQKYFVGKTAVRLLKIEKLRKAVA